jgi:hypothetical protein
MKHLGLVKDGLIIAVILYFAYRGTELTTVNTETKVITKTEWKEIEVPTIVTKTNNIVRQKDSVIYITNVMHDTVTTIDSILIPIDAKIYANTVHLDSLGYIDAKHIITNDEMRSVYTPYINIPTKTVTETKYVNRANLSGSIRYDGSSQVGINYHNSKINLGVDYDPFRQVIGLRAGYVFLNF